MRTKRHVYYRVRVRDASGQIVIDWSAKESERKRFYRKFIKVESAIAHMVALQLQCKNNWTFTVITKDKYTGKERVVYPPKSTWES